MPDLSDQFGRDSWVIMKVTVVLMLLLHGLRGSEGSVEGAFEKVLEKVQSQVPNRLSVCFFNLGWVQSGRLQTLVSEIAMMNFDLQNSKISKVIDVSTTCALNVLQLNQGSKWAQLFKMLRFDKYAKFVIIYSEASNPLLIAKVLHNEGITNVLFLVQSDSSVDLFMFNLPLTERITISAFDEDLFPDKLSNLAGYPYFVRVLNTNTVDVEVEHSRYMKLNVLNFISSYQNATTTYQKMDEKSPKVFNAFFDVIIPYYDDYRFESHIDIEQVSLRMAIELCLIVPKVRDPQYLKVLFRPFRLQLWAFVICGYFWLELTRKL